MIQGRATKNGSGIEIVGDYCDLESLYITVHKIGERLNEFEDKQAAQNSIIMNFAYEIRKSFEGSRQKETRSFDGETPSTYFGSMYLWTDVLFTISALRHNAGYVVLNELDQANMYTLEYWVRKSLVDYDPQGASEIQEFIGQGINIQDELIWLILQAINFEYLSILPSKKRFRNIPNLIREYGSPFSETHKLWKKDLEKSAKKLNCSILEIIYDNYPGIVW